MIQNMKSTIVITPEESDEETANKFIDWLRHNKPETINVIPDAKETRKYLDSLESS